MMIVVNSIMPRRENTRKKFSLGNLIVENFRNKVIMVYLRLWSTVHGFLAENKKDSREAVLMQKGSQ